MVQERRKEGRKEGRKVLLAGAGTILRLCSSLLKSQCSREKGWWRKKDTLFKKLGTWEYDRLVSPKPPLSYQLEDKSIQRKVSEVYRWGYLRCSILSSYNHLETDCGVIRSASSWLSKESSKSKAAGFKCPVVPGISQACNRVFFKHLIILQLIQA